LASLVLGVGGKKYTFDKKNKGITPQISTMATLLPSLSSDDENGNWTEDDEKDATDTGEVNEEFVFGGILVSFEYVSFHNVLVSRAENLIFVNRFCFVSCFLRWTVCGLF
jgi:hypothetical protein